MCLVSSVLKFPLLGVGTELGPGSLPVLSQAHEDLKFWILNGGLFLADLFGLNCYMFSAYFYVPVLEHKLNQEQEEHCSASTGWSPPKPWQSPCSAPLGPWACEFIKDSEGVKARAHGHIPPQQCLPADLSPQTAVGWQGWTGNGMGHAGHRNPHTCRFASAHVFGCQ